MAAVSPMTIEAQQELYREKNAHMDNFFERVQPFDFYREIFPEGSFERQGIKEDKKPNGIAAVLPTSGIALEIKGGGKAYSCIVTDELRELGEFFGKEFAIMSPISYYGERRTGKNARYLYAMTFDLDGVGMPQLRDVLHQMNKEILPKATFVVNSGTGLHLYYVLDRPIPMYPQNQRYLKEMKYALTRQIWNRYTSAIKEPQMQGIMQGFRVIGSSSKLGADYPVTAFRHGEKVSLEYLFEFIPKSSGEREKIQSIMQKSKLSIEEAKKKYPDWYERRIVKKERRGRWSIKRDLYDWWLHRIRDEIGVGHRFYGIMTLAIYAKKCGIDEDELRRDAFSLLEPYDEMSVEDINRFTKDDIVCALEMFNEDYVTFPRNDIAKLSGLSMPINKRNGRKQDAHLELARGIREVKRKIGDDVSGGGRPDKRSAVQEYMRQHPEEKKKAVIARELDICWNTVSKYYDEIRAELEQEQRREALRKKIRYENGGIVVPITPSQALSDLLVEDMRKEP